MTTNGNGKLALIANIIQGSVIVALVGIMLKLFLIVSAQAAANTVSLARVEERQQNQFEMLRDDVGDVKDEVQKLRTELVGTP